MQHRPTPDQGLISRIQKPDRNDLEPVRIDRRNLIFAHYLRLLVRSQHERNVRPIDIAVEQSHFVPHLAQGNRQVHR